MEGEKFWFYAYEVDVWKQPIILTIFYRMGKLGTSFGNAIPDKPVKPLNDNLIIVGVIFTFAYHLHFPTKNRKKFIFRSWSLCSVKRSA